MADKKSIFDKKAKTYSIRFNSSLAILFLVAGVLAVALIFSVIWLFSGNNVNKNVIAKRPDAVSSQEQAPSSSSVQSEQTSRLPADENRFSKPLGESEMRETAYFSDAVFVGDSITTGIDLYSSLSTTKVVASTGINLETALTAKSVKNKAGNKVTIPEAVKELKPKKIYLMLGSNGIDWMSIEQMSKQYQNVLDTLKKDNPDAVFYIQSIPPVTKEKESKSDQMSVSKIKAYNSELLRLAEKNKMYYIDVFSAIVSNDGYLSPDISTDGVHFKSSVYTTWIEYVRRHTSRYE